MHRCSKSRDFLCLLAVLLVMMSALRGNAQKPFSRLYWLNDNYTPVRVNALVQDAYGYIWAGTNSGLFRFNGDQFVHVGDTSQSPVTALAVSQGMVWVGYKNGRIAQVVENAIHPFIPARIPADAAIADIWPIGATGVLAATDNQLYLTLGNHTLAMGQKQGLPDDFIYTVLPLSPTRVLVASDHGLSDVTQVNGALKSANFTPRNGLPDAIVRVVKRAPESAICWLGTQQGGIALYDTLTRKVWVPAYEGGWRWGQVNDVLAINGQQAWATTEDGFLLNLKLNSSGGVAIVPYPFPGKTLGKLLLDHSGNLWCATSEGLLKTTAPYAGYLALPRPYSLNGLEAIAFDRKHQLWVAQDRKLYKVDPADTSSRLVPAFEAPAGITSLYADAQNRLWIGTLTNGLFYKSAGSNTVQHTEIDSLKEESILSIAGTNDCLWVSGLTGVRQVSYPDEQGRQTLIRHHTKASGIGTDYVYQIFPDHQNRIWMATDGAGVTMYDQQKYHNWSGHSGMNSKVVYALAEDQAGALWAATLGHGLYKYDHERWTGIGREAGLQDINISALSTLSSGQVIAVSRRGIDVWYPKSQQFRHYNRRLGLEIDSTSSVLNCIAKDAVGNVYVPFEDGLIVLKPASAPSDIRPKVHIAQVGLFMNPLKTERHRFHYDENYLTFYFDGLNFTNPGRLNFRYLLEGYNNHWIGTMDESVIFPNLPPGKYRFRLQVSMSEDFTGAAEDTFAFVIAPPLWKRGWFIAAMALLIAVGIYLLIRRRDHRLGHILKLRQERLIFEYEHLKSQVNPHFLFNSLNTLTGLIEEGDGKQAMHYTEQLSDLYRNMLTYRDRDLILLSEEWGILSAYLYIQQSRFGEALQVRVAIPEHLLQQRRIVPMALQLLVENAIKHNVVSRSEPLVIYVEADEHQITIRNFLNPKMGAEKGAGLGLENIRRRYELLTKRSINFGARDGQYIVTLPLL